MMVFLHFISLPSQKCVRYSTLLPSYQQCNKVHTTNTYRYEVLHYTPPALPLEALLLPGRPLAGLRGL
jgi:hypothetical protein